MHNRIVERRRVESFLMFDERKKRWILGMYRDLLGDSVNVYGWNLILSERDEKQVSL